MIMHTEQQQKRLQEAIASYQGLYLASEEEKQAIEKVKSTLGRYEIFLKLMIDKRASKVQDVINRIRAIQGVTTIIKERPLPGEAGVEKGIIHLKFVLEIGSSYQRYLRFLLRSVKAVPGVRVISFKKATKL